MIKWKECIGLSEELPLPGPGECHEFRSWVNDPTGWQNGGAGAGTLGASKITSVRLPSGGCVRFYHNKDCTWWNQDYMENTRDMNHMDNDQRSYGPCPYTKDEGGPNFAKSKKLLKNYELNF